MPVADIDMTCIFNYGAFGYGDSNQVRKKMRRKRWSLLFVVGCFTISRTKGLSYLVCISPPNRRATAAGNIVRVLVDVHCNYWMQHLHFHFFRFNHLINEDYHPLEDTSKSTLCVYSLSLLLLLF